MKAVENIVKTKSYKISSGSRKGKIRLDANENSWGCSPKVMEAIKNLSVDDISAYPEYDSLIEKISEYEDLPTDSVVISNGSDDIIRAVIESYIEEGDKVIVPTPTFTMFPIFLGIKGAEVVKVDSDENFQFPVEKVLNAIDERTKMIVIITPSSPAGTVISEEDLITVATAAPDTLIFVDEAYTQFTGKSFSRLTEKYKNILVSKTFSKAFGLAALRIGYAVSNRETVENVRKSVAPYAVNSVAVKAAITAIEDKKWMEKCVKKVSEERDFLSERITKLGYKVIPSEANFLLFETYGRSREIVERMSENNILIKAFPNLKKDRDFIRISIGKEDENRQVLKVFKPTTLLFDMDGVLIDVSKSYRTVIKRTAEFFIEEEVSFEKIANFKEQGGFNNDWDLSLAIVKEKRSDVTRDEIIEVFQKLYLGENWNGLILSESLMINKELLRQLSIRFKLGIVTGRPKEEALFALKRFGIEKFFSSLVGMEDVKEGKPSPEGINRAKEELGEKECWYIGDTTDDMIAAIAADIKPVGVVFSENRERAAKFLKEAGAEIVLNDVNELKEVLF